MRHNKKTQIITHLLNTFSPSNLSNFNLYKESGKNVLVFEVHKDYEKSEKRVNNLINYINEFWYKIDNQIDVITPVYTNGDLINEQYTQNGEENLESLFKKYQSVKVSDKSVFPKDFKFNYVKGKQTPVNDFLSMMSKSGINLSSFYVKDMESGMQFPVSQVKYTNGKFTISFEPLSPNKNVNLTFKTNF